MCHKERSAKCIGKRQRKNIKGEEMKAEDKGEEEKEKQKDIYIYIYI